LSAPHVLLSNLFDPCALSRTTYFKFGVSRLFIALRELDLIISPAKISFPALSVVTTVGFHEKWMAITGQCRPGRPGQKNRKSKQ
jgi:hypothetical protein